METAKQLSKHLTLDSIQENNFKNGELLAVVCYFTFFGETGEVFISTAKLDSEHPSYGSIEIASELSDSFNDLLEEHWKVVASECKKFQEQWIIDEQD